jgi:cyclohexanecarboxylate-CoA ligase
MNFDLVTFESRMADIRSRGLWGDRTIESYFDQVLKATPDKMAVVAYRQDRAEPRRISYRELDALAQRIALSLTALGVRRQDVVSFQLPNWWEFIGLMLACARIGAVANPLMPILREHELKFMLDLAETKVFIVPKSFRGFDYQAMARELKASLPKLAQVVIVDGDDEDSFERVLLKDRDASELSAIEPLQPDDVLLVMYTSGTVGEPKGVMHTSNTIFAAVRSLIERLGITPEDNVLSASPLSHLTGYAVLATMPLMLGATAVLQDVWEGRRGLEIMTREKVGFSAASTPFLADMCEAVATGTPRAPNFRLFLCAGAPIPPVLIERARSTMGLTVCSCWGMTEVAAASITEPGRAAEKSSISDGCPLPNVELMVADEIGNELPLGETGRLLIKTPWLFGGYLKRPNSTTLDKKGWFDTGDLAYADAEGYIRINGRSKDIIIRGGENIPVVEIENLLYGHPAVALAAIVAYPDARMGERACAFVVPKAGQSFTFEDMARYFDEIKLTKQYRPERLEVVEQLPNTSSGKIQKFRLREIAKQFGDA